VCIWRATSAQYVCTIECLQPTDDDCPTGESCSVSLPAVCLH
jgi:hypothetical protein